MLTSLPVQNRVHWVAWKKIYRPLAAGGLGIRSLEDTIYGLHGKFAWKFLAHDMLWTRILLQKYGSDSSYDEHSLCSNSSKLWKTLFPYFERLISLSQWQVGRGDISFWWANWCGEILNPGFNQEVIVCGGLNDLDSMEPLLTEDQMDQVKMIV